MLPIQSADVLKSVLQSQTRAPLPSTNTTDGSNNAGGVFGGMLQAAQQQIKAVDTRAQDAVTGLLSGQGVEVHDAMIATQQADLTLELALQVRNKAVAAYQQMMGMQF